jgi:hypothetical protein
MRFCNLFILASAKREIKKDSDLNPGPGSYNEQKSYIMNKDPSFFIGKKLT